MSALPGFHNPYNFVRTPDRSGIQPEQFAGDHDPSQPEFQEDHSRYWPECYTGVIPVRLRTQTPLFITDPETKVPTEVDGHFTYDCMSEIPATSLKGMLSSAYETITNSRYRVFSKRQHDKYLGYRHPARAVLTPARIVDTGGQFSVELYTAAWLPAYNCPAIRAFSDGQFCTNVTIRLYRYSNGANQFDFWSVEQIGSTAFTPITTHATPINPTAPTSVRTVSGYVVKSGKIFNRKHDERFFFDPNGVFPIPDEVRRRYERLIEDYQDTHKIVGGKPLNPPIAGSVHGKHITDPSRLKMTAGLFVYVQMNGNAVQAIYPVQISRDLSEAAPWDCLDESLRPATRLEQLSPADRLFGWVSQGGSGAWRGKVRIVCDPYDPEQNKDKDGVPQEAIEHFEPLPLSILGAPKPAQARFYCGDAEGKPQAKGISKQSATYQAGKKLRGRKVYLHHPLSHMNREQREAYWDVATVSEAKPQREYSRFSDGMSEWSNQNRSITSWIPKRRDFSFRLYVENLTGEEMGALLALLSFCDDNCYFRLGFGKPLGFGSVRLSIPWERVGDVIPVIQGKNMAEGDGRYRMLSGASAPGLTRQKAQQLIQAYQKAMVKAYGEPRAGNAEGPDLCPWLEYDFVKDLSDQYVKEFRQAWEDALKSGEENAPFDRLHEKEMLFELYPDLEGELTTMYQDNLQAIQVEVQNNFGRIPFIEALKDSMRGFNDPVVYPRLSPTNLEEGFAWFVENEKMEGGRLVNAYSLPEIGQPLDW